MCSQDITHTRCPEMRDFSVINISIKRVYVSGQNVSLRDKERKIIHAYSYIKSAEYMTMVVCVRVHTSSTACCLLVMLGGRVVTLQQGSCSTVCICTAAFVACTIVRGLPDCRWRAAWGNLPIHIARPLCPALRDKVPFAQV